MTDQINYIVFLLFLAAVIAAFAYYGKLFNLMRSGRGNTGTDWVGLPDIPMTLILGGALAGLSIDGLMKASKAPATMKPEHLLPGMIFLIILAGGVAMFLLIRRIPLNSILGLGILSPLGALIRGFLLLLASAPIVLTFNLITVWILGAEAEAQDLVKLFSDVSKNGDIDTVLQIALAGVIVAPICEELIFRGYFYPVAKRYLGPTAGALITAALFAVSHVNLTSLPGLMVLALCFIAAYEKTGSLLVPITMHACFNATSLVFLYLNAQGQL